MAEDKLYEESNESLSDQFLDASEKAVAAGVAAVSFYRSGGAKFLSKNYKRYEREIRTVMNEVSSLDYAHVNKRSLRQLLGKNGTIRKSWREYKPDDDYKIDLGARPGSPLELISRAIQFGLEEDHRRKEILFQNRVVKRLNNETWKRVREALRTNKAETEQALAFANKIARYVKTNDDRKKFALRDIAAQFGALRPELKRSIVDNAIRFNQEFTQWTKEHPGYAQGPMKQIRKIMSDYDTLRGMVGKLGDKRLKDTILGDRPVTLGEILDHPERFSELTKITYMDGQGNRKEMSLLHGLQKYAQRIKKSDEKLYSQMRDLYMDEYLRTDGKDIYTLAGAANVKEKAISALANTMPGKILKLRSFDMSARMPAFIHFRAGTVNRSIAALEQQLTHEDNHGRIQNDYFYVAGKTYRYDLQTDTVKLVEELKGFVPISSKYGSEANLAGDMFGFHPQRYHEKGSISDTFGINSSSGTNMLEYLENFLRNKYDDKYLPNIQKLVEQRVPRSLTDRYNAMVQVNEMLQSHVRSFTPSMLRAFAEVDEQGRRYIPMSHDLDRRLWELIQNGMTDTEKLVDTLAEVASNEDKSKSFRSEYLQRLISNVFRDQTQARSAVELLSDNSGSFEQGAKEALGFREQLQKGLSEEFVLRLAEEAKAKGEDGFTVIKDIIDNHTTMSAKEAQEAKNFAYATLIDTHTGGLLRNAVKNGGRVWQQDEEDILKATMNMEDLLADRGTTEGFQDASKTVRDFVKDYGKELINVAGRDTSRDIPGVYAEDNYMLIHGSAASPMGIIESINEAIKSGSADPLKNQAMDFFRQLKANNSDAYNVSKLTMVPYFFLRRLGDNDVGFLQFSNKELEGGTWGLAKGLTKRILPLAVGATYLDWANDTVGAITGTEPAAGLVNSLDYMDIGGRKFLDAVGVGSWLNNESYVNPIMQYWFGKDGYYDAEKQRDFYANGYEPVRRGRWWDFGSVNEFRGSQIEYYEPTLTRRLNSDYYDKSMYSGYWDKWGHSLLPTPTAPLSSLMFLLDPYYLENEHSEDRPYPVTGTLFQKDTPWGIVLNPTLGELIKPVKRMHEDRLTDDGQDAKAIIYGINKHIRDVASGQHAFAMVFDREQITAGEYTAYTNPTMGEYSIDIGRSKGQEMRQRQIEALGNGPMEQERRTMLYAGTGDYRSDGSGGFLSSLFGTGSGYAAPENQGAAGIVGNGGGSPGFFGALFGGSGSGTSSSPLDMLGQTNRQIYMAAARNNNTGGIITADRIRHFKMDDVLMSDDMMDLIRHGQDQNLVDQASRSFRLISGIYGYGANRAFGFGESDGRQIADSGDMASFSRSFWDESLGGIGGGAAEIGRRFIPEFRRNIRWNPLLNNQPDWIPEQYRFGDPYSMLPRGEARLPGKGYEALNNLHPDKYGVYGAFDRYKILADIAPSSSEFKIWRKIAQSTVKDPELQQEMQEIQQRVNEQQKQHDFYPYQILGHGVDYQDVTVQEVYNDGTFRVHGSNDLYTIAGVDFNAKHTKPNDYEQKAVNQKQGKEIMAEYLQPGMTVTVATDSNKYHMRNGDDVRSINAAVFVNGESLAQELLEDHPDAVQRKTDNLNAADTWAMTSTLQRGLGGAAELVAHLDLPFVHDKYLRVRDPLESYNAEQVYGTPYQTWSDITGTYLFPAMERAVSDHWHVIRSTAEFFAMEGLREKQGLGLWQKRALSYGSALMDRGAFIGGMTAKLLLPGKGNAFEMGKRVGALAMIAGNLYTSTQSSTTEAAASWATAGLMLGDFLDETKLDFLKEPSLMKRFARNEASWKFRGKYALAGAAIGVAARGMFGPSIEGDGRDHWTPERVQKKWELEDYFDRLNYIKNMGLYHKAAALAESEEGTNMEKIFNDYEEWSKKRQEIMEDSDVNNTKPMHLLKLRAKQAIKNIKQEFGLEKDENNHRFEYDNGFSINDLPGVRNGVFHSEEISEEERLYTLNALVTMGIRYNKRGTDRTQEDRDMTQLREFEKAYHTKIPDYYQVHHIIEFSQNGPDDPSNMIALNPDDHLYITEQQHKLAEGDFSAAQIGARTAMRLGEYGRAALLYKKAAESTMYGLRADARWNDIEMALPKYERDYFQEFMKEKDPDKQEEILKSVSPFLRRALKQVWGMDYEKDKGEDNDEYFKDHNLPNFLWEGWRPDSDLNNIKAKTIKNEGMLFSDFGIYESKYRDPKVINAPNLSPKGSNNPLELQVKLQSAMSGLGLQGVEVSVEPKSSKGTQTIVNLATVTSYKFKEKVNDLFSGNI